MRHSPWPYVAFWLAIGAIFVSLNLSWDRGTRDRYRDRSYQRCLSVAEDRKDTASFKEYLRICGDLYVNDTLRRKE